MSQRKVETQSSDPTMIHNPTTRMLDPLRESTAAEKQRRPPPNPAKAT
jgi:hypothetical protein